MPTTNADVWDWMSGIGPRPEPITYDMVPNLLRAMQVGETREFRNPTVVAATVTKYGEDEFRVNAGLPTSYPNTVRLLRNLGVG
jgi:hypothetical protein